MPREYQASDFFFTNSQFETLICRPCEYAVHYSHIRAHLTSTVHRIPATWAQHIQDTVQQWDCVTDPPNASNWPQQIEEPIPGVTVHQDGLLCLQCKVYTCRQIRSMKAHWLAEHQYQVYSRRGRPTVGQSHIIQDQIEQNCRPVPCQRLFTNGIGSHYIPITRPAEVAQAQSTQTHADMVGELMQQVRQYQREEQDARETVIQAGDLDEATPWLRRTGWVRYLQGVERRPLIDSMERPAETAEGDERAMLVIWEAMHRLASVSQQIATHCGHLIRIDIVRDAKDHSPHKPFQAYLEQTKSMQKHIMPWQKIMMFFARTQV